MPSSYLERPLRSYDEAMRDRLVRFFDRLSSAEAGGDRPVLDLDLPGDCAPILDVHDRPVLHLDDILAGDTALGGLPPAEPQIVARATDSMLAPPASSGLEWWDLSFTAPVPA